MMIYSLLFFYVVVLSMLSFLFVRLVITKKMKRDLAFFVLANYILSFSFLVFFFYYKDIILSFVNIILLSLNSIFLHIEIKHTYDKYKLFSLPYLIYILVLFFIMFDLLLMNL